MTNQEDSDEVGLADLRGFNPTIAQDRFIDRYMDQTGMSFSRLADMALQEFFQNRGHEWPKKYGKRSTLKAS